MHRLVPILLLLLCGSSVCRAEKRTIHGFVIEVISPTKFKIDDYDMSRDEQFSLDFNEIAPPGILNALKSENIRVGTEIEIKGDDNRSTHRLTVKSVHVFPTSPHQFNSTALLEKPPELQKTASGWSGYIFTDGERVQVTNSTIVTLRVNRSELKKLKAQNKEWSGPESTPLTSLNEINLDTMAHYEGVRQEDGSILASKVEFEHVEMEPGEVKLWQRLIPEFKDVDTLSSKPAELHILRSRYKIVPIQDAQD